MEEGGVLRERQHVRQRTADESEIVDRCITADVEPCRDNIDQWGDVGQSPLRRIDIANFDLYIGIDGRRTVVEPPETLLDEGDAQHRAPRRRKCQHAHRLGVGRTGAYRLGDVGSQALRFDDLTRLGIEPPIREPQWMRPAAGQPFVGIVAQLDAHHVRRSRCRDHGMRDDRQAQLGVRRLRQRRHEHQLVDRTQQIFETTRVLGQLSVRVDPRVRL